MNIKSGQSFRLPAKHACSAALESAGGG